MVIFENYISITITNMDRDDFSFKDRISLLDSLIYQDWDKEEDDEQSKECDSNSRIYGIKFYRTNLKTNAQNNQPFKRNQEHGSLFGQPNSIFPSSDASTPFMPSKYGNDQGSLLSQTLMLLFGDSKKKFGFMKEIVQSLKCDTVYITYSLEATIQPGGQSNGREKKLRPVCPDRGHMLRRPDPVRCG